MLVLFHSNDFANFQKVSSLSSLPPHSFQSDFTHNNNNEMFFKKTTAFTPSKPPRLDNSPNKMEISQSPSLSFEDNDE